jgi:hypothetical protein
MPVISAQTYIASLLQGMTPPGDTGIAAPIDALITPLDPDVNPDGVARCYVWPARGPEKRRAMPRNTGAASVAASQAGWKQITHDLEIFLVWMDSPDDASADVNFPLLIDYVMFLLRTSPNEAQWLNPYDGLVSHMINVGEVMTYDFVPPRTLEAQMHRRYDARVTCSLLELFQS